MKRSRLRRVRRVAVLLTMLTAASMAVVSAAATPAQAAGPDGPDTCLYGYRWRLARTTDRVCVLPQMWSQAQQDNANAWWRWVSATNHTCIAGYVWRNAWPGDDVCTTPFVRNQVAADNAAAASRRALDSYSYTWSNLSVGYVRGWLTLEMSPNGAYSYRGHLHNNGFFSYDVRVVCVQKLLDGDAISFSFSGNVAGDIDVIASKSRDWNNNGTSAQIVNHWTAIPREQWPSCTASTSLSVSQLLSNIKAIAGIVGTIISIVG